MYILSFYIILLNLERRAGLEPASLPNRGNVNLTAFFADKNVKLFLGFSQLNYLRIKEGRLCRS
jgi:hypothetical protein